MHRALPVKHLVAAILDEVRRFSPQEQRDDITLIVARCRAGYSASRIRIAGHGAGGVRALMGTGGQTGARAAHADVTGTVNTPILSALWQR